MKLFPHPVLSADHVEWGAWRVVTTDSSDVLSDHLQGWDYQQEIHLQVDCHLNVSAACGALGVTAKELVLLATVDCPTTSRRFSGVTRPDDHTSIHRVESDYEEWESWEGAAGRYYVGYWDEGGCWAVTDEADVVLDEAVSRDEALRMLRQIDSDSSESWQLLTCDVTVPKESVARQLELAVQFLVMPTRESGSHPAGARVLVGPSKRTHIEGDGSRFPTEPVSFRAMGWPNSLWRMQFGFESPNDSFAGAARLFINVDHPGAPALLDPQQASGNITRAFLRLGIVRTVLTSVARESRNSGGIHVDDTSDDATVAAVADSMAKEWLKLDLDEAILRYERSPEDFETALQASALTLPKQVFS